MQADRDISQHEALRAQGQFRRGKNHGVHASASRWKRFGYRRIHMMLQREGIHINHKKVYRLYKKAGLALKRKLKRKIYAKRGTPDRSHLLGPNDRWSMDFVSDITVTGRRFRIFA